jgi:small subunit ribosomal protein S12e
MSAPAVENPPANEETTQQAAATAAVDEEPEDVMSALAIVIKKSIEVNGLIRGISQVARALDSRTAHLCILADDCEEAQYKKLIAALCSVNNIDLVRVPKREELAEWAGLVKRDRTGAVKKHFKCSCVAIRNFGEQSKALEMLLEQIK